MSFEYIKQSELLTTFNDAKKFMMPLFEPFEEFERIARNRPHPGIAKELPKVTDGTLASIIKESPKRIIQQIPTGNIEANDKWLEIVGNYILNTEILPNSNEEARLLQKCWATVSKSMIYGGQPAFVKFLNRGDYFGTDFVLPYVKDVFLEPGKVSDRASNVIMLSTWWSKNQIEALIAKHKKLSDDGGWDLKVLADLIAEKPGQKDATQQTPSEKNKQLNNGFYQIVHTFQCGIGANFYSFAPRLDAGSNVVRTKKNPDIRGVIPIHYMYADQDLSNPLGVGAVEMSGGLQNLIDSEMQMYQYNRALMLNPPIKKWGSFSKSVLKMTPNAIWELGANKESGDAEPATIDSTALANFANNYSLMKSQILNLNNSLDTSVSAEVGNPGFSKTDAGVKAQNVKLGNNDNHLRKQFESWFEDITETQINLYFAERSGVQELTLDQQTADKLRDLEPNAINEQNLIRINYDTETPKLTFKVDTSSSNVKDDTEQSAQLSELLQQVSQDPMITYRMSQDGYRLNMGEAYKELYSLLGIKNINKIITHMTEQEKQQAQAAPMPMMDKPKLSVGFDDLADLPEAQQGVLQNAGVDLPIEVFQQAQQVKQQMEAAKNAPTDTGGIDNHPLIKLMTSLNIKFTDLDSDTQRYIITEIFPGAPATGALPSEVNQATQIADTHLKAHAQAHAQALDQAKIQAENDRTVHDQATKMLEMAHTHEQAASQDQMSQAQFAHTVKQDNKPQPKTGVK